MHHNTDVQVPLAEWEAGVLVQLLSRHIDGMNDQERKHIQNHIAQAVQPIGWQALVVDPEA